MRVLVTGSDGYIGAVLAPFLVAHREEGSRQRVDALLAYQLQ